MKLLRCFIIISSLLFSTMSVSAKDLTPNTESSILIESSTGKILYGKNIDKKLAPASMTKMMTILLTIESIDNGKITYKDKVRISKNAASMGGSQIFMVENDVFTVKELLKAICIASANDASVAIAEYIGGTEDNFVKMMNVRAKKLGLKNTMFKNPHGLDDNGHLTTARDLSIIAKELVKHEEILKITGTYEAYIYRPNKEKFWLVNTNKLIRVYNGMDGLKTGFTDNAGYSLTATAKKNDMRLISVVMKSKTSESRSTDTINLLEYGFNLYNTKTIINKNKKVGQINISNSKKGVYPYYVEEDVKDIKKKGSSFKKVKYKKELYKIEAPIKKKQMIGKLYFNNRSYNLITNKAIKKANYFENLLNNFKKIISGNVYLKGLS